MFHLLQPLWMLAAGAIVIPIFIHLWNIRQRNILKIGSIAFFSESSKTRANSLRFSELLLLILRCLLILLLAFLLSKPTWDKAFSKMNTKGWVMMEKENLPGCYSRFRLVIDSLLQDGYDFHYFNDGFESGNLEQALKQQENGGSGRPFSYRMLLKALDQVVPEELPVYLFTNNYLHRLSGKREAVSFNLHWLTYTPADSVSNFIAEAYVISRDSVRVFIGTSAPAGITYSTQDISLAKNSTSGLSLRAENGMLLISLPGQKPRPVDTTTLSVTIFTDRYFSDARYIQAAVLAVQQFSRHLIRVSLVTSAEAVPPAQDWLFWLSDQPLPANVYAHDIFRYQEGEVKNTRSWIIADHNMNSGKEPIALFKRVVAVTKIDASQRLWQDGFGNAILSREAGDINNFHLFTHFDPSWTDLPWSDEFPQLIFRLLYPRNDIMPEHTIDKRVVNEQQLQPARSDKKPPSIKTALKTSNMQGIFWVAAFIVFCTERFVALRTKKEVADG